MRNERGIAVAVLLALVLAAVVGLVFAVIDEIDEYSAAAALVTFLVVLVAQLLGRDRA